MSSKTLKSKTGNKAKSKQIVKQPEQQQDNARLRKKPKYKSFRLSKAVKPKVKKIPSWWKLTKKSFKLMGANKKAIFMFVIVFGLIYAIFVGGFSNPVNVQQIRENFVALTGETSSTFLTNVTVFNQLVRSTTSASGDVAAVYQLLFLVISSLAFIWLYRQQQAGNKVGLKMAFYRGMYPLIPYVLVLMILALQTIPASIGAYLYNTVKSSGYASTFLEQFLWLLLYVLMIIWTLYMVSSTIIAAILVTLPEWEPLQATKKAKELALHRRMPLLFRILSILIFIVILYIIIVFPLIFVSALLAQIVFFLLTILLVPFVVAYMFVLYRELL